MQKTRTILFISNRDSHHNRAIFRGMISIFHKNNGWDLWNVPLMNETTQLDRCVESNTVAGIIGRELHEDVVHHIKELGIPFVSIGGSQESLSISKSDLKLDELSIPAIVTNEFVRLGLKNWGYVHHTEASWSYSRQKIFAKHANSLGIPLSIHSITDAKLNTFETILATSHWLTTLKKPCGVFACNDQAALDLARAAKIAKINIPDELAIIGVDNDPLICESGDIWLSSVELHRFELGQAAAIYLKEKIENHATSTPTYPLKPSLIVRESSHKIDQHLLAYQQAIEHIRINQLQGIKVSELAKLCSVSKRSLERAFRHHSNTTPAKMIREKRTEAILHLLLSQKTNLENLAERAGFSDASGLSNFIIRMTGKSPSAHRNAAQD